MLEPIPVPQLPINFYTTHIIAFLIIQAIRRDAQRRISIHRDIHIVEPRTREEIDGLGDDGVHAHHLPNHPGIQRAGVRVSGDAVEGVFEELVAQHA